MESTAAASSILASRGLKIPTLVLVYSPQPFDPMGFALLLRLLRCLRFLGSEMYNHFFLIPNLTLHQGSLTLTPTRLSSRGSLRKMAGKVLWQDLGFRASPELGSGFFLKWLSWLGLAWF